jgi:hypothetical protein
MPDGLQLSSDGVVSGTPNSQGSYRVNIKVSDQRYPPSVGPAAVFTLTINVGVPVSGTNTTTTTSSPPAGPLSLGHTVRIAARTRSHGCLRGTNPDRRCSPGAIYSGLTKNILCSPSFHTRDNNLPARVKRAVEIEYGMSPKAYGSTLEIDHIVPFEIGGSNDIANLYPEKATPAPGFHVKDRLEIKLHALVCAGQMTLRAAQSGIAMNWQTLYKRVFAVAP